MAEKPAPKTTILVVDDEPDICNIVSMIIQKETSYQPITALSGERALALAWGSPPDVILLDLTMPGMNGHEVLHRLREDPRTKDIPVIMLSSSADEASLAASLSLGARCHLSKPIQVSELLEEIRLALDHRRGP